jgi:hypothetical protein
VARHRPVGVGRKVVFFGHERLVGRFVVHFGAAVVVWPRRRTDSAPGLAQAVEGRGAAVAFVREGEDVVPLDSSICAQLAYCTLLVIIHTRIARVSAMYRVFVIILGR